VRDCNRLLDLSANLPFLPKHSFTVFVKIKVLVTMVVESTNASEIHVGKWNLLTISAGIMERTI
jgi:hypothetical protein